MPKPKYILSSPDVRNPVTGEQGDSACVYDDADLKRRQAAAQKAGARINIRPFPKESP